MREALAALPAGTIVQVRVKARAEKNEIVSFNPGTRELFVCVKAAPVSGKANAAVLALLKKECKRSFMLVAGATAKTKRVKIR